jgi:tetratricopeptide (TPR) repeat protein
MKFFNRDSQAHYAQSEPQPTTETLPLRQFDIGIMAENAAKAGNVQEADSLYRKAMTVRDEDNDSSWLIGNYSTFLRAQGRTDEAFALLKSATDGGTDLPYLWNQLISILAEHKDVDGIMDLIRRVPVGVATHDQVTYWIVQYANERTEDLDFAERLARRGREFARAMGDQSGEWLITGRLGHIIEKSGRIDEAIDEWQSAFDAGSNDPTTAVRLSMALDKAKRFDEAQAMIRDALTRGLPASSEENLKKRLAKIEARQSPTKTRNDVTAFSVRFGADNLKLRYQIRLKPTLKEVTVIGDQIRAHCAAREVNEVVRINIGSGKELERSDWPIFQFHISAPDGWGLGEANPPRVGSGSAVLTFIGPDDKVAATKEIPDSTSGIAQGSGQWYVGCRDGRLYCFDRQGNLRWTWVTPGADEPVDSVYFRPCPYFVTATEDFVTFSSWDNLYALSNEGALLWERKAPSQGPITVTRPLGGSSHLDSWKILGLSPDATDDQVKSAYRRLALDTHPDRNPNEPSAAEHFRNIQSAYESLLASPHQSGGGMSITFTISMQVLVSKLFALNNEIVVVSTDGVMAFLSRNGEVKNRRVLGRSAAQPVFDSNGTLRVAFCEGILSFFEGESIVNAAELDGNPSSISLWGDDVIVAESAALTLFNRVGVRLWAVEFSKRLVSFSAENDYLVCSAGALIVFERSDP